MRRKAFKKNKKTCAAHSFFQRLTTHSLEIFLYQKQPVDYPLFIITSELRVVVEWKNERICHKKCYMSLPG